MVTRRLGGMLADRPNAVAALTQIFLDELERLLRALAGEPPLADATAPRRSRLGGISCLYRFGSSLNHDVHFHAYVTDGVFMPAAHEAGCDAPPAFLPTRPITSAAADMLPWETSGLSIDACVRITLIDRGVPSSFQSLKHLLR